MSAHITCGRFQRFSFKWVFKFPPACWSCRALIQRQTGLNAKRTAPNLGRSSKVLLSNFLLLSFILSSFFSILSFLLSLFYPFSPELRWVIREHLLTWKDGGENGFWTFSPVHFWLAKNHHTFLLRMTFSVCLWALNCSTKEQTKHFQ